MRFVVLMAERDPEKWNTASPEEIEAIFACHRAFDAAVEARGTLESGAALASGSRTLRGTGDERVVTDGPYAETVEQLSGIYVVDLPSFDDAVEIARLLPEEYTVEVREVARMDDY